MHAGVLVPGAQRKAGARAGITAADSDGIVDTDGSNASGDASSCPSSHAATIFYSDVGLKHVYASGTKAT